MASTARARARASPRCGRARRGSPPAGGGRARPARGPRPGRRATFPGRRQLPGPGHPPPGAGPVEVLRHLPEVVHGRPDRHRHPESGRLQGVVAALGHQRAADERRRRDAVEPGKLAEAVEQEDRRASCLRQRAAPGEVHAARAQQARPRPSARDGAAPGRAAPFPHRPAWRRRRGPLLLPGHGRAGEQDRPAGRPGRGGRSSSSGLRAGSGRLVLEIAGDRDPRRRHAEPLQAVAVLAALDAEARRLSRKGRARKRWRRSMRSKLRSPTRPLTTATGRPRRRASESTSGQ